jgi:DNA phosphorothioation-associated putative methyltransferase
MSEVHPSPPLHADWTRLRQFLTSLPYGKVLPTATYLHRDTAACQTGPLGQLLASLSERYSIGMEFNVVKFRTDGPRISFLCYPAFFEEAHPALEEAIAIDLCSGRSLRTTYRDSLNPPILHRKELLMASEHPRYAEFAALSVAEEEAGLYADTAVIGFRINWERLLAAQGVTLDGHSLRRETTTHGSTVCQAAPASAVAVQRHKTALTRYQLSRPVKTLLQYGQLSSDHSFLDYGCGLGTDVRGLRALGFNAVGWDPAYAPESPRTESAVVNLGYVLNVIEDPAERLETLCAAWGLAKRLLVVSAQIGEASSVAPRAATLNDGVLTQRQTFQKYFGQQELQCYIEDALETTAVPVALGIFYVFRDPSDHQLFIQSRSRRRVDWGSVQIGVRPAKLAKTPRAAHPSRPDRFAEYAPLLDELWSSVLQIGRLPLPLEFPRYAELCSVFGSAMRALRRLLTPGKQEIFDRAQAARKSDLLVYLATANLRKVLPFAQLPESVRADITSFFGTYRRGLTQGRDLLHSAADSGVIVLACDEAAVGWQDERSLYVRPSQVERLPAVLRTFVACAELLYGDIHEADILRIHKFTGKVTFLTYADFDSALLPALYLRTRVNLRTAQVDVFDHAADRQLLCFKERFLDSDDPQRAQLLPISDSLRALGISDSTFLGPKAATLQQILADGGVGDLANTLGLSNPRGVTLDRDRTQL